MDPLRKLMVCHLHSDVEIAGEKIKIRLPSAKESAIIYAIDDIPLRLATLAAICVITPDYKQAYRLDEADSIASTLPLFVLSDIAQAVDDLAKKKKS